MGVETLWEASAVVERHESLKSLKPQLRTFITLLTRTSTAPRISSQVSQSSWAINLWMSKLKWKGFLDFGWIFCRSSENISASNKDWPPLLPKSFFREISSFFSKAETFVKDWNKHALDENSSWTFFFPTLGRPSDSRHGENKWKFRSCENVSKPVREKILRNLIWRFN